MSHARDLCLTACVVAVEDETVGRAEFERLLNGLVYELFFPDDLRAKNIRLFDACAAAGVGEGMDAAAIAAKIFHPSHTIYGMLFDLQSVEAVRIIEGLD